jgi:hypothetical protein
MKMKFIHLFLIYLLINSLSIIAQKKEIFEKLNLGLPALESVNLQIQRGQSKLAAKNLLEYYQQKQNLFLKVNKQDLTFIKQNYSEDVKNTIAKAELVLDKNFIFRDDWDMEKTNIPYQFKGQIDWKAMPNGDEEWCFMLNRHKYWIDLGRAYYLTGNEKYAKAFVEQAEHWIDNNPLEDRLKKLSWRRIEAGIRCENWVKAFEYLKNAKSITPAFLTKFMLSLYQHGEYLNSSFSAFSQTSNWGVLEFQGLFTLSHFFSEYKIAPQWQRDALANLETCIKLQVLDDGSQWEQSPMYHNEVFHCYMNVNLIAQTKNLKLPEIIIDKTKDMAYANVKWQKPNFHQPLLGDSDDTDLRGILTLSSYLFDDPVLKSRAFDNLDYETYFLLGSKNSDQYKNILTKNPNFTSIYQQSSGDFFMRSSWNRDAAYTGFHLKKLGCGHGHDNLLHFTIYANNQDYLIDSGRFSYVDNDWRKFFKSNSSHNTLSVDNLPNSIYKDSWLNETEARSQGDFTVTTSLYDYGEAENTAYKRLKDPVSIKRRMLFLKPNIWVVFDSFSANGSHTYTQYFNFPDKNIVIKDDGLSTTFLKNNLRIQPVKNTTIKLVDSWFSPEYNLKKENLRAEISREGNGFDSFISVLYFPEQTNLKYQKIPVYNRSDILLLDSEAEAIKITSNDVEYTLLVVHNSPVPAANFFKVNNILVRGEVILIEKNKKETTTYIIKE